MKTETHDIGIRILRKTAILFIKEKNGCFTKDYRMTEIAMTGKQEEGDTMQGQRRESNEKYDNGNMQDRAQGERVRIPAGKAFICCPIFIGLIPITEITFINSRGSQTNRENAAGIRIHDKAFLEAAFKLNPNARFPEHIRMQEVLLSGEDISMEELGNRKKEAARIRKEIKGHSADGAVPYKEGPDLPAHIITNGFDGTIPFSQIRFMDEYGNPAPRMLAKWAEILEPKASKIIQKAQGTGNGHTKATDGKQFPPIIPSSDVTLAFDKIPEYDPARKRMLYGLPKGHGADCKKDTNRGTAEQGNQGTERDIHPAGKQKEKQETNGASETKTEDKGTCWETRRLEDGLGYLAQESELVQSVRETEWETIKGHSREGMPDSHPYQGCSPRPWGWCNNDCLGQPVRQYDLRKPYMGFCNSPANAAHIHKISHAQALAEQTADKFIEESIAAANGDCRFGHGIGFNRYGRHTSKAAEDGRIITWTLDDGWWNMMFRSATYATETSKNGKRVAGT